MHPTIHAKQRPDHAAIIMADSGEIITYAQMDAAADRIAHLLRSQELKREDAFAVLMENHPRYLEIVWGSQRAGTMLVPIATRLTVAEIAYIIKNSDGRLLITSARFTDLTSQLQALMPDLPILILDGHGESDLDSAIARQPGGPIDDPAPGLTMLYSSGTTGRPKGIRPAAPPSEDITAPVPLMGLATMGAGMPADGSMIYLSPAPLYHAAPLGWCATVHRLGGTVVIMEAFGPEAALAAIEKYRITDSQWVPTHFVRMLKLPEDVRTSFDLSSHQRALHAAAPCPVPVKREMIAWWGPIINEYYAGSEGTGMTLIKARDWLDHPGSVGKAIYGTLHVCRADGEEAAPGEDGLVYFENAILPHYHNDDEKTAEAINPQGWMTIGDIGHVDDDGYLYLTDRASHMIISGGVNIYPQEIENLLVTHDKVMDAAVIGAPDDDLGERVVAVVQPVDMVHAGPALEQELKDFLGAELSRIKMPKQFDFRPDLPREANGKLYKRELRGEYASASRQKVF